MAVFWRRDWPWHVGKIFVPMCCLGCWLVEWWSWVRVAWVGCGGATLWSQVWKRGETRWVISPKGREFWVAAGQRSTIRCGVQALTLRQGIEQTTSQNNLTSQHCISHIKLTI